jgi:hypothetical protein
MRNNSERRLVTESPHTHHGWPMQAYITREATRPCKQWIHEVLAARREADRVKLRTPTFVLLPDVDCVNKRLRRQEDETLGSSLYFWQGLERGKITSTVRRQNLMPHSSFHWLAVVADTGLRTLRDLRGEHVPMLQQLHAQACQKIHEEYGTEPGQIMAYIHYPPSVYQLHVHFKHLTGHHVFHDTFRVHPLLSIINNLKIDPDFYRKSSLQLPVYVHTDLYAALTDPLHVTDSLHATDPLHVTDTLPESNQIDSNLNEPGPPEPSSCSTMSPGSTPFTPAGTSGTPTTPSATPALPA